MRYSNYFELVYVLFIVALFLWSGLGGVWDHKIMHDFPYGYLATDSFQHQTRAQWIKDVGDYRYEAPYYSGGHQDIVGFYPPMLNHLSVILSHATGLEVYDAIYFLVFFFASLGIILMYLLLRYFNKALAIVAIPFVLFILAIKGSWVGFFWGHWPSTIGDSFLLSVCFAFSKINVKNSKYLLALTLVGSAFGHTSSTVLAFFFILIYYCINLLFKKFDFNELKELLFGVIIFLILSSYFLFIFQGTWMHAQPYKFQIVTSFDAGGGFVQLIDFGVFYYFIIVGVLLSLFYIKKSNNFVFLVGLVMLILGLTNYVGFGFRAFNLRFYWPIFLSVFMGLPIYYIIKRFKSILPSFVIGVFLSFILINFYVNKFEDSEGLMNANLWDMINWIKNNIEKNENLLYFYGDYYDQFAHIGNTNRLATRIEFEDYFASLRDQKVKRYYMAWLFNEHGSGLPYKKSLLSFGYRDEEDKRTQGPLKIDVCEFKYFVIDKVSRIKSAADFNNVLLVDFLKNGFEKVYENPMTVILKNNDVGGDCVGV